MQDLFSFLSLLCFDLSLNTEVKETSVKRKLPDNEISILSNPTISFILEDIKRMVNNGVLTLGEPCASHDVIKTVVKGRKIKKETTVIYGRKFSLQHIRQTLLKHYEKLMFLHTDEEINSLSLDEITAYFNRIGKKEINNTE